MPSPPIPLPLIVLRKGLLTSCCCSRVEITITFKSKEVVRIGCRSPLQTWALAGRSVSQLALGVPFPSTGSQPPCQSQKPLRSRGAAGVGPPVQQACREDEREEMVVSPWTLPSEIHRILHGRPESLLQVTAALRPAVVFVCIHAYSA